jgi:ribosomal protein S27AE
VKLKTAHCPRCGAEVRLDGRRERGTCAYCGTTSYVEKRDDAPVLVIKAHVSVWLSLALGLVVVLIAAATVWMVVRAPRPDAATQPRAIANTIAAPVTPALPALPTPPVPIAVVRTASFASARFVQSAGDAPPEVLVPVQQELAGKTTSHFATYDPVSAELLHRTPALDDAEGDLTAVVQRRLVLASPLGQVRGFDLASLDPQWSTALGERVAALCEANETQSDALHVVTDDGRNLLLDLMTGRQSATRRPCQRPLAVSAGRHAPGDRRDYRAPRDVEAWHCGLVRVMGSQSYVVPDACKVHAKVDSDRLDGMVGHAMWRFARGQLVFGVRTPGTYVPMVGLLERKRWVWKTEVPAANPLEAEQGGPRTISLHGDSLVLGYASRRPARHWLTALSAKDGTRRWHRALPETAQTLVAVDQADALIAVHTSDAVRLLSPRDGSIIAIIGGP